MGFLQFHIILILKYKTTHTQHRERRVNGSLDCHNRIVDAYLASTLKRLYRYILFVRNLEHPNSESLTSWLPYLLSM